MPPSNNCKNIKSSRSLKIVEEGILLSTSKIKSRLTRPERSCPFKDNGKCAEYGNGGFQLMSHLIIFMSVRQCFI